MLPWIDLVGATARADDLAGLLAKGPVTVVESRADGRVNDVIAILDVHAPVDVVWNKIVAFDAYTQWMPQVEESTVLERTDTSAVVQWSISTPGPNVVFKAKYTLDPDAHEVKGAWVSGALQGSHWEWRLASTGGATRVYRTTYSSAVADNWLLRQFDDKAHTLELGLNAAAPIVELEALKKACE